MLHGQIIIIIVIIMKYVNYLLLLIFLYVLRSNFRFKKSA